MVDWKLLGEVPDSEDEDAFDSQELATGLDSTTTHSGEIPVINHQDIGESIGTQNATKPVHNLPSTNGSLSSSPLSSAQSVDGLPELDTIFLDGKELGSRLGDSGGGPNEQNSLRTYIDSENNAPTTLADLSRSASPNLAVNEDFALSSQDLGLVKNAHDLQRESVRLERSLRPRKPIQEHPYLLENAQYSSLIRQHGMRPVQMAMARARAARDESPQDGEFQDDSQGNSLPDLSNSSQLLPGNDMDESGDLSIYNIPSSSPPITSPWLSHRRSSNHGSSQGDTDNTSVPDQDLPALHELLPKSQQKISPSTKRPNTTSGSSARKRRRHDIVDSDPMDVDTRGQDAPAASDKRLAAGPLPPIPRLQLSARRSVDVSPTKTIVTIVDSSSSEAEEHEEEETRERQGSITDDSVNERLDYKRRIRGVLPASWLRLDQKASRDKAQKNLHIRQRNRTPEKEVRRGLAQTRTISNAVASTNSTLFFDDSDDEETVTQPATADKTYHSQSRIFLIPDEIPARFNDDLADQGFIIEHDTIDTMFSGPTRRRRSNDASRNSKIGHRSNERATTRPKQQKITASFNRSKSTPSGQPKPRHERNLQHLGSKRQSAPRPTPTSLSVLDVIEPDAPQFLRVAARTAKTRVNQGRSSPSKKIIRLAERVDHIDAVVLLNQWKLGSIPQRQDVSEARKNKRKQVSQKAFAERAAGQPTAARTKSKQLQVATQKSRKFVKQISTGGSARYLPSGVPSNTSSAANIATIENNDGVPPLSELTNYARRSERIPADSLRPPRPATLEAEDVGRVAPLMFHRRKKFLDSIYRKNNRDSSADASDVRSEVSTVRLSTASFPRIGHLMAEKFQVENLLRSLAEGSVTNLLLMGIDQLQESYMRLRETGNREQGLRVDQPTIHSWALVMQILEIAHIPRGTFWDVLRQTTVTKDRVSASEARTYESIWKILFTVLPLSEFNSSGILIPGKRYEAHSDGWMIVQQLLRPVFSIYRENTRQAPSFNNYCRALITRCHYLVQQWGWRRSGSIIGVIFDFFGSQNLEHLRNEEANASPRFLEQLAGEPSLAVEPGDKCFHVFLKLLALSIQKLRATGAIKDIRNLVARIIPNHNRQHFKEQTVHERDLAALRNHHDLLATLFWAAPPDLRPSPALIERLVAPETSHKEASLINIRCWGQIARFIVAKGEASTAFKPFHLWRNSFFQKMVQQFDSAAADIQQQLLALPSEVRHTISEDVISSMISMNKEAVGDVLQASIAASLDVMKHAAHLEAATFCLNTLQLQHVYKQFGVWPPELNWNTLRKAISTLDLFVDYIAEFKENEESQQSESHILDSVQGDDALLLLDHEISKRYFSMVRCILFNGTSSHGRAVSGNFGGIEQGVAVAARLAASFINGGLVKLHELFKRGKFGLFDGPIHRLDFNQRQYLVLVVVTLLKADIDDFTDAGFTLCELWLLLLVRPNRYLKYQSQLAEILRERGEYFLPSADDGLTNSPNYECNGTLFEFAISTMRRSIRDAAPNLRRILTADHSKALKLVMEQMKEDLKATSSQPVIHVAYVAFARRIISLIRTHGSEICALDNFYYQISKDYSPSVEDPQLQIAAMVSYGLRLREGDPKVVQRVFFFLFNNFKMALISDSLDEEKKMLQKGMAQDRGITQFVLGKMLPAIIEATASKAVAYPLLDLYVWAAGNRLKRSTTTYCLTDAELPGVKSVLQTILNGVDVWIVEQAPLTDVRLHTLRSFFAGFNLLWPSIYEYSLNQDISSGPWSDITELISTLEQYVIASKDSLCHTRLRNSPQRFDELFAAVVDDSAPNRGMADVDVRGFVDNIKQDVDRNWFEADGRISIQTPGKPRGEGALQGVLQARWDATALIAGIKVQFMEWLHWKKKMDGSVYTMERDELEMRMF
ncbi:hypothetical protein MY11210_001459 [Beauveria gryllotalpidicola]